MLVGLILQACFYVVRKRIFIVMLLVLAVPLYALQFSVSIFREEGVGFLWCIVYLSKTETVCQLQYLLVDACPAYYVYILVFAAVARWCCHPRKGI